ncbi:MAG: hypothetical protein ACXVCY_00350 [Pseudobdellovibrionaceae bacterium]
MFRSNGDFQLIIVDAPYENWDDPLVQNLFVKTIGLKNQGYGNNYEHKVMPVDTSDFFGTHILLCEKQLNGTLNPVMGFKSTTLKKCRDYNLGFPGLGLVQSAKMPLHCQAVENIMQSCDREKRGLAYYSSWTIDTKFKKKYYEKNGRDLSDAFCVFYLGISREQKNSEVILGGTLRFRTEKIFEKLGHKPLSLSGQELPPIYVSHLAKEPVLVMHSTNFSDIDLESKEKWLKVWNDRIHLGNNHSVHEVVRKAA